MCLYDAPADEARVMGQAVGTETRAGAADRNAWLRISGLVILAVCLTAIVASRSIEASQLHGRLSVPPLYDDVSYFLDAVRWMNAAGSQSIFASGWSLLHQHAPFSTLVSAIGFRLVPDGYVGPYVVNAIFVFAFLLGIIWLSWKRPFWDVATCLVVSCSVPTIWHVVTDERPDLPWGLSLSIAAGTIVRYGILQRSPLYLVLLGAGCGLAVSIKPTAFPASFAFLGVVFGLRLLFDCIEAGGLRVSIRKSAVALLAFGLGLLAVTALLLGPMLIHTIRYIFNVFVTQREIWTSGESFWTGLRYFLVGAGGKAGLNFWLWVGLSLMALRLLLTGARSREALMSATVLLVAVIVAYAIPSVQEIKTYFFGATFYGIFIVAMALNYNAIQSAVASDIAAAPFADVTKRRLLAGARGLPLAAATAVFVKLVIINPVSLALWLNDQQQNNIRAGTERVWKLVREASPGPSGPLKVGFSSAYPVTSGTIELFAAQTRLTIEVRAELFHRTLDETEKALLKTDMMIVTTSLPHTLVGPRMGDALIERMDANKSVCLFDSLTFADVQLRIYKHSC